MDMLKVDGWQTLAAQPIAQPIDVAARDDTLIVTGDHVTQIPTTFATAPELVPYGAYGVADSH
jgi:hypothetical protein